MSDRSLTDYQFWKNYWLQKDNLIFKIPSNYPFTNQIREIYQKKSIENLIEIGGFPGYYSVWAKKELNIQSTLLDFVIIPEIVDELKIANNCKGDIKIIENDLFSTDFTTNEKFDLVISNGLIEHFENTKDIILRHVAFLNDKGVLFISLPNFTGLNGWFQKRFDRENYNKHYIPCMNIEYLTEICQEIGLKDISVNYSGGFMLWLENESKQPFWVKIFKKMCWLPLKIFFKIIPIETKYFSPYILITANQK